MDIYLLRVFQSQVAAQCRFMLRAAADVNNALKEPDTNAVFYGIQNFLNAAANISKAFWGQGGKFAEQRKPLRDSVGVADTSPLRQVVMRNNFEHFDERLDRWWKESKRHNFSDLNIGLIIAGIDEIDSFRNFDPKSTDLSFWGQKFNLQELINEVRSIVPKLEAEASKPHWE